MEAGCECVDGGDGRVDDAAFDLADVRAMEPASVGQLLLAKSEAMAEVSNALAEGDADGLDGIVSEWAHRWGG